MFTEADTLSKLDGISILEVSSSVVDPVGLPVPELFGKDPRDPKDEYVNKSQGRRIYVSADALMIRERDWSSTSPSDPDSRGESRLSRASK